MYLFTTTHYPYTVHFHPELTVKPSHKEESVQCKVIEN
jgi:hypothetical protein